MTPKQKLVLTCVQRGLSNKQIAKQLNISESTVKSHITPLLKIFAARNRSQLALFSMKGVNVTLPDNLEALPFGWVHRHGDAIVGIIFKPQQPKEGWEPIYLKRKD